MKTLKEIIYHFLIFTVVLTLSIEVLALSPEEKTERMKRYNAHVRAGVEMLWAGRDVPESVRERCDSLSLLLYNDSTEVPLYMKVLSRLTVECYNLASGNGKTDYHQIVVALNSCKNAPAFYDPFFINASLGLGEYKLSQNDNQQALAAFSLALKGVSHESNKGRYDFFYPVIYLQLAQTSYRTRDNKEAVGWQSKYVEETEKRYGKGSDEWVDAIDLRAFYEKNAGMEKESIDSYKSVCDELRIKGDTESDSYLKSLLSLAELTKERICYDELLSKVTTDNTVFSEALSSAFLFFVNEGDKDKITLCIEKVLSAVEKDFIDVDELANFFPAFDLYYVDSSLSKRFLDLIKRKSDRNRIKDSAILATAFAKCGDFENALIESGRVKAKADEILKSGTHDISDSFLNVVSMWGALGDFKKGAYYLEAYLPYAEKEVVGMSPEILFNLKKLLASYYSLSGDINESKRVMSTVLSDSSVSQENMSEALIEFAGMLQMAGDYEGAVRYCNIIDLPSLEKNLLWGLLEIKIASLISLLDLSYDKNTDSYKERLTDLRSSVEDSRKLVKDYFSTDPSKKVESLMHLATLHFFDGGKTEMLVAAEEAEKLIKMEIENKEIQNLYLSALSLYFIIGEKYQKALELSSREVFESDIEAVYSLQALAEAHLGLKNRKEAQRYYGEMAKRIMDAASGNFSRLTEQDKEMYWRMFERQIADAGRFADENDEHSVFGGTVYNLALNSKGLLLNSSISFSELLGRSSNPEVAGLYGVWKNKRRERSENLKISAEEGRALDEQIKNIEISLLKLVPESGNLSVGRNYTWEEVKRCLDEEDVAIEFLEFQDLNYNRSYAAAVLSHKVENPIILILGNVEDIDKTVATDFKAESLWKKLLPFLSSSGHNYFSASGNLNCLPIESLLLDDGNPIYTVYPLSRLSSTRELIEPKKKMGDGMALFGGIEYGKRGVTVGSVQRSGVYSLANLPGTEKELEAIEKLTEPYKESIGLVKVFKGLNGSEENFRKLSGSGIGILHLGTHGYFIPYEQKSLSKLPLSARRLYKESNVLDNPMLYSGLFFADANVKDKAVSSNDGVITALEISELDFSNVDLAVLSACESGLGRLSGDGVFGMQRGLKLAGVNSVMMTLEKVDDAVTCEFITEFYKEYLNKVPKSKAFENAKEAIRKKYPDERHWATFILLDGM